MNDLIDRWRRGDENALAELVPRVYGELRRLARQRLRRERPGHTLDTAALVHEVYLRMREGGELNVQNRTHFLAVAANTMRNVLVDYARSRSAQKRGGSARHEPLNQATEERLLPDAYANSLLELDDVLKRLESLHPRCGRIIEQRFFGGLTLEETADHFGLSVSSVKRDLRFARAWLAKELTAGIPLSEPAGDRE